MSLVARAAVVAFAMISVGSSDIVRAEAPPDVGHIEAEATTRTESEGDAPPPPRCWWEAASASGRDRATELGFWEQIEAGARYDDVLVFLEGGTLRRTFSSTRRTYVLQVRVCSDPDDDRAGERRWSEVGPPNPTVYWDELTERVTRRVPVPAPDLGFELGDDGRVRVIVNVGLWVGVANDADVVARAEPAAGVWAETRARLDRIEFDTGTGVTVVDGCDGAGTRLPDGLETIEQGPCGYTYTTVDELGERTAVVRAIWTVTNTASTGATERRADIVLETPIAIEVLEIQTVGTRTP